MLRGPTYDDSYITRKLSHMPTFSAPSRGYLQSYQYPSLAPPPRHIPHRLPPSYYDYDYGYGGGYYGYVPPPVRMSRYDTYLDDDLPEPSYLPRYRPRVSDVLDDVDYREKSLPPTDHIRSYSSGAAVVAAPSLGEGRSRPSRDALLSSQDLDLLPSRLSRLPSPSHHHRYQSLSEPQMLQDHVDKMRIRLKSLAYSLEPTGPVPEIVVPERAKKTSAADDKKYTPALEYTELPKLASRRQRYYPEDQHMKDNLRIQCLSHYKTTRSAADYWKPKQYIATEPLKVMPESSRYSKFSSTKWEEPDTVFGAPSDKKPFSKVETGSSFFSTSGITNRKKDYVAEKAVSDGATEEASEEKKERRKKKKSKERDIVSETALPSTAAISASPEARDTAGEPPVPAAIQAPSEAAVEAVSVPSESSEPVPVSAEPPPPPTLEDELLDEKERKRLEKKKRKAEREAAAKAAMEAELAALAAAEAELARLEAESTSLKPDAPATPAEVPAADLPADGAPAEGKSESAAEKCESPAEVVCEGVCVNPGEPVPFQPQPPCHLPLQEDQQLPAAAREPLPAPEPPLEVEPPVEGRNVELPEESQPEAPVHEPEAEGPQLESPAEPQAEETQVEPPAEEPQAEEPQVGLPVEAPQVEAQVEAPYVKDSVAEEAPVAESRAEEEPDWLETWAREEEAAAAPAAAAADETGP